MRETFTDKFDNSKIELLAYVPVESVISSWEAVEAGFLEKARLSEKKLLWVLLRGSTVYNQVVEGEGKRRACR